MKRLDERSSFKPPGAASPAFRWRCPDVDRGQPRGFTLDRSRALDGVSPGSQLAGCAARKGRIAEGYDADFVIFDPEAEFVVTEDRLYYRYPVSPYLGRKLRGVVKATYLRGQLVFSDGAFSKSRRSR
jgi:allantoinase